MDLPCGALSGKRDEGPTVDSSSLAAKQVLSRALEQTSKRGGSIGVKNEWVSHRLSMWHRLPYVCKVKGETTALAIHVKLWFSSHIDGMSDKADTPHRITNAEGPPLCSCYTPLMHTICAQCTGNFICSMCSRLKRTESTKIQASWSIANPWTRRTLATEPVVLALA